MDSWRRYWGNGVTPTPHYPNAPMPSSVGIQHIEVLFLGNLGRNALQRINVNSFAEAAEYQFVFAVVIDITDSYIIQYFSLTHTRERRLYRGFPRFDVIGAIVFIKVQMLISEADESELIGTDIKSIADKRFFTGISKWSKVLSTFEPVSGDWLVVSGDSPITVSSVNKRA